MGKLKLIYSGENPNNYTRDEAGNKALNLMILYNIQDKFDFIVPDFFVIPTSFYKDYARKHKLEERLQISSLKDLQQMTNEKRFYADPDFVPDQISECFKDFYKDYRKIILPAFRKLTRFEEYMHMCKKCDEEYPDFWRALRSDNHPKKSYGEFLEEFNKKRPGIKEKIKELNNLGNSIYSVIFRSSSPLEDAEYPFAGVFRSNSEPSWGREEIYPSQLTEVLSSSYTQYAQYYMEKNNIKDKKRELAIIAQRFIRTMQGLIKSGFCGEVHTGDNTIIKYSRGSPGFSEFWVEIEDNRITRYDGKDKTVEIPMEGYLNKFVEVPVNKISEKQLLELSNQAKKVRDELKWKNCCIEFVIDDKDLKTYFVQLKPSYENLRRKPHHRTRELPLIDKSKIITYIKGFTVGDCKGPFISLLKYQAGKWESFRDRNLDNLTIEHLKELDKRFPGAIYAIDPFQFFCRIKSTDSESKEKLFHMLTPNKAGVIIYNTDLTWDHMGTLYNYDKVHLFRINDFDQKSPLLKLKDREIINICSTGKEAVIYRD